MSVMVATTMIGSTHEAELLERDRARKLANRTRRNRVEILRLPHCLVCGGATGDTTDPELLCVCVARKSALQARVEQARRRAAGEPVENFSDVVAP